MPDPTEKKEIISQHRPTESFQQAAESEQKWAIRYGAEPFDFHLTGKGSDTDKWLENQGVTAGIGTVANTNYIEIGTLNDDGEFQSLKRVHAMGLTDNWEMEAGDQRLIGFVVDGKYTPFTSDTPENEKYKGDLIQRDDPHATEENQLQHASGEISKNWLGEDYTKVVFQGSEREVLQMYGAMIRATIELNNNKPEDMGFELFGRNSNAFNSEMKEKLIEISEKMGVSDRLGTHNAAGLDLGRNYALETSEADTVMTWDSLGELRSYIDTLEKTASEQLQTLRNDGISTDLDTKIPGPCDHKP